MLAYNLPQELIAQRPAAPRDACRLLVANRENGQVSHRIFRDLPQFLRPGDCLVFNDTKVMPARIFGRKARTGGRVELLLLSPLAYPSPPSGGEEKVEGVRIFRCLGKPGLQPGVKVLLNHGSIEGEVLSAAGRERVIRFSGKVEDLFALGHVPLPPYIDRPVESNDAQWYQTVFAREEGAVAAPTAGLHFTEELLERIRQQGVEIVFVTLHVGWGTFQPVTQEEISKGILHPERFLIPTETIQVIDEAKRRGGRVIAVGTTVVRVLETYATGGGSEGTTGLFIRPPYRFKLVDAMITNFHLSGTSLLLLVSAFAGEKQMEGAYHEAIKERYRFYSYGDAMLIL